MIIIRDGHATTIALNQLELADKQYNEKQKRMSNLIDGLLMTAAVKVTYGVKMMSKAKTVHSIHR